MVTLKHLSVKEHDVNSVLLLAEADSAEGPGIKQRRESREFFLTQWVQTKWKTRKCNDLHEWHEIYCMLIFLQNIKEYYLLEYGNVYSLKHEGGKTLVWVSLCSWAVIQQSLSLLICLLKSRPGLKAPKMTTWYRVKVYTHSMTFLYIKWVLEVARRFRK